MCRLSPRFGQKQFSATPRFKKNPQSGNLLEVLSNPLELPVPFGKSYARAVLQSMESERQNRREMSAVPFVQRLFQCPALHLSSAHLFEGLGGVWDRHSMLGTVSTPLDFLPPRVAWRAGLDWAELDSLSSNSSKQRSRRKLQGLTEVRRPQEGQDFLCAQHFP